MNEDEARETALEPEEMESSPEEFPFIIPEDSSPEEVFQMMPDCKTLLAPRLQSMKKYIAYHYRNAIIKQLNKFLAEKIQKSGKQYADSAVVSDLNMSRMSFWSIGKYRLAADIRLQVEIDFGKRQGIQRTYHGILRFDMADSIALRDIDITDQERDIEAEYSPLSQPLDEFLIPVMSKEKIEERAEQLLKACNHEGWEDEHKNVPYAIAKYLGLKIVRLPLHNSKKNKSQLFFKNGIVTIDTGERDEFDKPITQKVNVDAETIVINTNAVRRDLAKLEIYHECVHHEWHYMFYKLQDMYTNDLRKIRKSRSVRLAGRSKADALSWLEFQAMHASFAVWMPRPFMSREISERMAKLPGMHPGLQYEKICMGIAKDYNIPPYRVRARIIRMGRIKARGACNYLDDHFVSPFSFDHDKGSGNYTFFIDREQFSRNYEQDKDFRCLIDSRQFMYVDGHVCINDPTLFTQTPTGPGLVPKVLEHIDQYCLRFVEVYERDETYIYRFGRLHSDQEYNKHFLYFPPEQYTQMNPMPEEEAQQQKNMQYLSKLPRLFPEMLVQLMTDCKVSVEKLAGLTGMSTRTINRLRNEARPEYSIHQIVAIIVGLHLPPWISDELLDAASIRLSGNPAAYKYKCVVTCMFMEKYTTVQKHLAKIGVKNIVLDDLDEEDEA